MKDNIVWEHDHRIPLLADFWHVARGRGPAAMTDNLCGPPPPPQLIKLSLAWYIVPLRVG